MASGKYDRRVTIERATVVVNTFNEKVPTWLALVANRHCNYMPVSDGERLRAGEKISSTMARFKIRHSVSVADVNPKDRLQFEGRIYDINGVKEVGRNREIEITATARAD